MKGIRLVSSGLTSVILLSALITGGAWWARSSAQKKEREERNAEKQAVATVTVAQKDFELGVTVVGKLEAVKSTPVVSEVTGKVARVIPNGSRVKKDDVIVELDAPRMARQVRDLQNQYDGIAGELAKQQKDLAMGVEKAQLSLTQARQQHDQYTASQKLDMETKRRQHEYSAEELKLVRERYVRKEAQAQESLIPKTELEAADADIKAKEFGYTKEEKDLVLADAQQQSEALNKKAAVQQAESELKRAQDAQQDEIKNIKMRQETTKQQLDRAKDQLSKATIRSPGPGIVVLMGQYGRFGRGQEIAPGDGVWERMTVATIPDLSQMRVALELNQEQVRRVKRGLKVRVHVETAPGKTFHGEVTEISQNAQQQIAGWMPTGERVFQTAVLLKDTKGTYLRPGTTSVATIVIERMPKALVVPLECIFDRDAKKVVYVRREGNFEPAEVELGPQNEDMVVIRKGLHAGDRIAMHDMKGPGGAPTAKPGAAGSPL